MTPALMTLDYKHLVAGELRRAALCKTDDRPTRHLNRAAIYAHQGQKAGAGSAQPGDVLDLIGALSASLDDADRLGLRVAAIHINQAIVDLGGSGTPPPDGPCDR